MPWPISKTFSSLFFVRHPASPADPALAADPAAPKPNVAHGGPVVICLLYNVPDDSCHPAWLSPAAIPDGLCENVEGHAAYAMSGHHQEGFQSRHAARNAIQPLLMTGNAVPALDTIYAWDGQSDPSRIVMVRISDEGAQKCSIIDPPRFFDA